MVEVPLCAFVLALAVIGLGCSADEGSPPSPELSAPLPDQEMWGWTTVVTEGGRRRATVMAGHFRKHERAERAELDGGVRVIFYDSAGKKRVSELTARRAEIGEKTWDMLVSGVVVLVAEDSTRLETDLLRWRRKSEKITGEGQVTISRPEGVETGVGFEASSDLKRWTLRQVTTRLRNPHAPHP